MLIRAAVNLRPPLGELSQCCPWLNFRHFFADVLNSTQDQSNTWGYVPVWRKSFASGKHPPHPVLRQNEPMHSTRLSFYWHRPSWETVQRQSKDPEVATCRNRCRRTNETQGGESSSLTRFCRPRIVAVRTPYIFSLGDSTITFFEAMSSESLLVG